MPAVPSAPTRAPLALPCPPGAIDDFLGEPLPGAVAALRDTPGPFLVLGAGGKIGLHLCVMLRRALTRLGRRDRVVAVSRFSSLRDRSAFEQRGIETLPCDLADPAQFDQLPDAPTVFFLAGVKFGTAAAPELLRRINVEVPRRVALRYAAAAIVAFSSGCVYPFVSPASGGATEETPTAPVGDYALSCLAREEAFAGVSAAQGTRVALLRLNYSVEFRYGVLVDLAQRVLARQPIDVTTGHINAIWQNDAVAHSIQALGLVRSPAMPVNITGPDLLSVREVATQFGDLFGTPVEIVGREADTAWLNNAARSHRLFGPPAVPVEQMMRWIAAWLQQGGETWGKPTGFERRDGRF